jgi:HD-GYP domain-containing protein (c-di-GMP phosphodiesterase class II)
VKITLLHAIENQAVARTVEQSHEVLRDFATVTGAPATITYVGDTIFICGQLLRASRGVYESALELGTLMGRCGVSELSFDPKLTVRDLLTFAAAAATALREPDRRDALSSAKLENIVVRPVDTTLERREGDSDLEMRERILRFYASALVVMRRFYDSLAAGTMLLPHRVKRLAQHLVTLSESGDCALLGMTAMANAHRDDAGRAVQTALIAVAIGRDVTNDRLTLSRLAMAALLADVGRVRVTGPAGRDRLVKLGEAAELAIPPATSAASIVVGGVNAASALRTVVTYEATVVEREALLGRLYGGRKPPLVQAQILHAVRALLDRLAPRDASNPLSPLEAIEALAQVPNVDPTILRLLVRVLGVFPVGTVIELETGEWAVVVGPSASADAFDRPRVRLVTDRAGRVITNAPEYDLGVARPGRRMPTVLRIVPPREARFNVTRVFVA